MTSLVSNLAHVRNSFYNNYHATSMVASSSRWLSYERRGGASQKDITPAQKRSRFQIPHRENPRLRVHAVSIERSDYSSDGTEDPFGEDGDGEDDDNDGLLDHEKISDLIQEDERLKQEKKKKWLRRPAPHVSVISDKGESYGKGGRKTARARVWIRPGHGEVTVNRMPFIKYFDRDTLRDDILQPLVVTRTCGRFDVNALVNGGGKSGQAGALRLGIARALNKYNPDLYRPALKYKGFLTRDPRKVERKKVGLKKARKAPQWVRR